MKQAAPHRPYHNSKIIYIYTLALPIAYLGNTSNCLGSCHEMMKIIQPLDHIWIPDHGDLAHLIQHLSTLKRLVLPSSGTSPFEWSGKVVILSARQAVGWEHEMDTRNWLDIYLAFDALLIFSIHESMNVFRPSNSQLCLNSMFHSMNFQGRQGCKSRFLFRLSHVVGRSTSHPKKHVSLIGVLFGSWRNQQQTASIKLCFVNSTEIWTTKPQKWYTNVIPMSYLHQCTWILHKIKRVSPTIRNISKPFHEWAMYRPDIIFQLSFCWGNGPALGSTGLIAIICSTPRPTKRDTCNKK